MNWLERVLALDKQVAITSLAINLHNEVNFQ